ncbi:MAG: hypothetical protein ACFFE4_18695 [Candidatus Thorarchaeota archaeon]
MENERVKLEFKNCHSQEQVKIYYKYKRFIQGSEKIFLIKNLNPAQIEKEIGRFVRSHSEQIQINDRPQFKSWFRKYIVISKLYDGKCIACEQITIKNNLPGLQLHHRDLKNPNRKQWKILFNRPIPEIVKTLKCENCVAICANCQRMIHSHQFKKNHEEIVESEYWDEIKHYYKKVEKNVKNFEIK